MSGLGMNSVDLLELQLITDTVMGGVSQGTLTRETVQGREAVRMRGRVSLDNNGGFIQMAANLSPLGSGPSAQPRDDGSPLDASAFSGIELVATDTIAALGLRPNREGETYNVHLRTTDITRPWQSYRQSFIAGPQWETHRIPFTDFVPHRIDTPLDVTRLTRIGIVAIGREFEADISVANIRFY